MILIVNLLLYLAFAPYSLISVDIEKDRRDALALEKLIKLVEYFGLTADEKALMFDLADKKKSDITPDIPGYIKYHDYVSSALRTVRDLSASEKDWQDFIAD
ncbi:MAG: hypothetical protein IJG85_04805 [Eubacteriaceae bacterium]|nr:hypothetical protein [Eubacteriaceae bacterium]